MELEPIGLAFEVGGDQRGESLFLSSSLGTTRRMWNSLIGQLGERFRVIRYDHRGHGGSPTPPGPYSLADLGKDLLALADFLSVERFHLAGVSLGGMVGMWVGAHAPERVEALTLIATFSNVASPALWRERAVMAESEGLAEIAEGSMQRWFTKEFRSANPQLVASFQKELEDMNPLGYSACCRAIADMELEAALARIQCPTLLIAGDSDVSATPDVMESLTGRISGARLETIPGAHLLPIEQPSLVARLMVQQFK